MSPVQCLLVTPPMLQLNSPYPASQFLAGTLKQRGISFGQEDLSLHLANTIFSAQGLSRVFQELNSKKHDSPVLDFFRASEDQYIQSIDAVMSFLRGENTTLSFRIQSRRFLPEGPRFHQAENVLAHDFNQMGLQDGATYLASLFLDDIQDLIREMIDPHFTLARYGERLSASQFQFDPLLRVVEHSNPSLIVRMLDECIEEMLFRWKPELVAITVPFPGNVLGAFLIAKQLKKRGIKVALGGGYVNTELRSLKEQRVFDFFDYVALDHGGLPLLRILEHSRGRVSDDSLVRTFVRRKGTVEFKSDPLAKNLSLTECGFPTTDNSSNPRYISILEMLNPMHRLWSFGRWNKLVLAQGCYWKKCTFCDTSLPYIKDYQPQNLDHLMESIRRLRNETGESGFHFVDEAAPPRLLRALSERLIREKESITWWTNIRFEQSFTSELAELMSEAGCIAVTGGLEVASNRLLRLMKKGVSVEQVAQVTSQFSKAGILVHAYLMYGFPTQTNQETVDSLEMVRQLFEKGCLQSAFWHRFALTVHSPLLSEAESLGLELLPHERTLFSENDLPFMDRSGTDHDSLGEGLRKALYNYMHGIGFGEDVRAWFPISVPKTKVPKNFIASALKKRPRQWIR